MSDHDEHHQEVIEGAKKQLEELFEDSEQALYLYLDDNHKACNKKFSDLLGYSSPEEWAAVTEAFPDTFLAEASQERLVNAYKDSVEKLTASDNEITWKKKGGGEIKTQVILVPHLYEDHLLALHFIS